ncbi:hypothetical protein PICMEDRAFT_47364 [Pichia membranifaciens NRRL Y-2026]|uniref:Na(+)/H(+) antiporter n=1 Tax=Pichia membranifaciens NRRL Y-2026 TaxID=763406 RepID=A0A1E3NQH3_9ASCO|nr:hypothetical protein PICMEDRAFT_47364 [Pichia membranifaciens NRRL Y-2026]ODQ48354.1 hypothetical protein PICMEDRAFT_47364 [Pichia membranifaciens NRRL Y-2026]
MVWSQLDVTKAHVAYAVVAVFSTCFSLCSLFVKEKLYLGEASVATIYGLIVGPHCLNWFNPLSWGNYFYITLEISRVLLCIEIVAVSVELPKKYVLKHWFPLFLLLIPCMTAGWLIIGVFIYLIIPGLHFSHGLLISACVTATDPILAQAVVGKGKFAKRVPAHLRNLLSAESACNDGVSVPFVYLALNIILHGGHSSEVAKEWICVTVLYECGFGCIMGSVIGYTGRKALKFAENHDLIDHESFLAFYIMLALLCAGFGSILGVDDLLASFCAGTAFAWDGWFTHRTEESNVSTVIDILLNMAYFVYFGSIIPWQEFNDTALGLNCWRLICIALVVLCLRRIPAVLSTKMINPDIKNWKEAFFVGHFGPIGVGAVFAAIIAISDLEADVLHISHGPSTNYPVESEYYQLIRIVWPTVCFLIVTSIVVHGSSVAVLTLGKQLQSMTFTMTWTKADSSGAENGNVNWFNRLPKIERSGTSFSLKRVDTMAHQDYNGGSITLENIPTIETSGTPIRPAGGANRKKKRRLLKRKQTKKRKIPPVSETLDLRNSNRHPAQEEEKPQIEVDGPEDESINSDERHSGSDQDKLNVPLQKIVTNASQNSMGSRLSSNSIMSGQMRGTVHASTAALKKIASDYELKEDDLQPVYDEDGDLRVPTHAYNYRDGLVIEDQHGEVLRTVRKPVPLEEDKEKSSPERVVKRSTTGASKSAFDKFVDLGDGILFRNSVPRKTRKLHGYRINDDIIIENEDGEVLGRYKVNVKKQKAEELAKGINDQQYNNNLSEKNRSERPRSPGRKLPSALIHDSDSDYDTDESSEGDDSDDYDDDEDEEDNDDDNDDDDDITLDSRGHAHVRKVSSKNENPIRNRGRSSIYDESKFEKARRKAALSKSNRESDDEEEDK